MISWKYRCSGKARRGLGILLTASAAAVLLVAPVAAQSDRPPAKAFSKAKSKGAAKRTAKTFPEAHLLRAVSNPARPAGDRKRDAFRKPAHVLTFFGIQPGMKVGEMMAGAGYYTEILSAAVGPEGHLYAHNSPFVLELYAEKPISERLARMKASNVTRLNTDPASPGLPESLDALLLIRFYHDFYWMEVDRAAFLRAAYASLKPGGIFGIVDHHAEAGSGDRDAKDRQGLHRVDAEMVKKEILAAGFVLDAESDLLKHPEDDRTLSVFADEGKRRDRSDRFVWRFKRP